MHHKHLDQNERNKLEFIYCLSDSYQQSVIEKIDYTMSEELIMDALVFVS